MLRKHLIPERGPQERGGESSTRGSHRSQDNTVLVSQAGKVNHSKEIGQSVQKDFHSVNKNSYPTLRSTPESLKGVNYLSHMTQIIYK